MGQNITEMNFEQKKFLFREVAKIVNKFQILNNLEKINKIEFVNDFSEDLYYNLILKANQTNLHLLVSE
jgi:hypothetical protein